ncbi:MAG: hypothetical protein H7Y04_13920, partial [Verrucomicrobia bacterium]|nr:hypothetical protein [Cytophagales bacterium]
MNWYYIIIAAAALQGFLLAVTIKNVSNNKKSLSWLSGLLIAISVCLVGRIFYEESLFGQYPKIAISSDLMLFTYGPLIFWYLKSVFFEENKERIKVLQHFIPSFFHLVFISQFLLVSNEKIFEMLAIKSYQIAGNLTEILGWIHISVYLTVTFHLFKNYPEKAKTMVSNLPTIHFFRYFFILNAIALV